MQTSTARTERQSREPEGIVYQTQCQNPGCGHTFALRITPRDVGLLSGTMPCPRCKRHGGMLKPAGRIGDKLFAAKLVFKPVGISSSLASSVPTEEGDLVSDMMGSGF